MNNVANKHLTNDEMCRKSARAERWIQSKGAQLVYWRQFCAGLQLLPLACDWVSRQVE